MIKKIIVILITLLSINNVNAVELTTCDIDNAEECSATETTKNIDENYDEDYEYTNYITSSDTEMQEFWGNKQTFSIRKFFTIILAGIVGFVIIIFKIRKRR